MATQIKPGSRILVKVVKAPTNAAAEKTLARLLCKDAAAKREVNRQRSIRKRLYDPKPRGGRTYAGHIVKQQPMHGKLGESGTITASLDVLRDLASVERFVEVTPA
ncbi:MAG: hypothetical protein WD768_07620 [Phycisphaeraceae bacterium]